MLHFIKIVLFLIIVAGIGTYFFDHAPEIFKTLNASAEKIFLKLLIPELFTLK